MSLVTPTTCTSHGERSLFFRQLKHVPTLFLHWLGTFPQQQSPTGIRWCPTYTNQTEEIVESRADRARSPQIFHFNSWLRRQSPEPKILCTLLVPIHCNVASRCIGLSKWGWLCGASIMQETLYWETRMTLMRLGRSWNTTELTIVEHCCLLKYMRVYDHTCTL